MAKEKKMKKGSALIPWGIVLIVLGIVLGIVGSFIKNELVTALSAVGGLAVTAGFVLLIIGIIVAIVRGVKAKKANRAEERGDRRGSGRRDSGRREEPRGGRKPQREEAPQNDEVPFPYDNLKDFKANPEIKEAFKKLAEFFVGTLWASDLTIDLSKDSDGIFEDDLADFLGAYAEGDPVAAFSSLEVSLMTSRQNDNNPDKERYLITYDVIRAVFDIFCAYGLVGSCTKFAYILYNICEFPEDYEKDIGIQVIQDEERVDEIFNQYVCGVIALHNQHEYGVRMAEALARKSAAGTAPRRFKYMDCDYSGKWMDEFLEQQGLSFDLEQEYQEMVKTEPKVVRSIENDAAEIMDEFGL